MKVKIFSVLITASLLLSLAACSENKPSTTSASEAASSSSLATTSSSEKTASTSEATSASSTLTTTSSAKSIESSTPKESVAVKGAELGETLDKEIKVMLDGVVYTFPGASFADLEANGWTIDPGADGATLAANTTTRVEYSKGDFSISLSAVNTTASPVAINQCECSALVIDRYDIKDMPIALPGGITLGSTPEEIEAAYGSPSSVYDNKEGERLSMEYKINDTKITFQFFEKGLSSFDLRC